MSLNKCAVIYYSKSGRTKQVADAIKARTKADMYLVEPEEAYGGYLASIIKVGKEKLTRRPAKLKTKIADFTGYDVIFIGFPVWYGTLPPFFQEYIKQCGLKGKRIIPFATSGGTGKAGSLNTLKELLPESEIDINNYYFATGSSKPDVNAWLDNIN